MKDRWSIGDYIGAWPNHRICTKCWLCEHCDKCKCEVEE